MRVITVVKMLWTHEAQPSKKKLTTAMTRIVVDKSTHHAKPHSICFLPQYQRNEIDLCLDNWKHRLGFESARAALCKWAACTRRLSFQKLLQTRLINLVPRSLVDDAEGKIWPSKKICCFFFDWLLIWLLSNPLFENLRGFRRQPWMFQM